EGVPGRLPFEPGHSILAGPFAGGAGPPRGTAASASCKSKGTAGILVCRTLAGRSPGRNRRRGAVRTDNRAAEPRREGRVPDRAGTETWGSVTRSLRTWRGAPPQRPAPAGTS